MPTESEVANMALSRLGTKATITSLTENSTESRVVATWYATTRDSMLRMHDWNFARVNATLALSGTSPTRWTYQYSYPSDCLRLLRIDMGMVTWSIGDPLLLHEIGSDGATRFIWMDQSSAVVVYTQRVTDPNRFDPMFTQAFVDRLAANIAFPITQKTDIAARLAQLAQQSMDHAAAANANEGSLLGRGGGYQDYESSYIVARG